jgi:hypothetical protein
MSRRKLVMGSIALASAVLAVFALAEAPTEVALAGYRAGKFADGSVIAFDLLEAKREGSVVTEGARKVLGVMQKDAAKFAATGGWGFEGFAGGDATKRAVGANAEAACYGCHAAQSASDFVFSTYRD